MALGRRGRAHAHAQTCGRRIREAPSVNNIESAPSTSPTSSTLTSASMVAATILAVLAWLKQSPDVIFNLAMRRAYTEILESKFAEIPGRSTEL
ncbi:hypothetical protein HPP92_006505 [Vanilla planifolia]|uniref:Uncharacterized protein n=1 Tax=Vanilla planifolia TaxID=51239 RepID=A0A835RPC5_VANPL|nr:hypothetical protein HPP92_006505 [Vanilla planifolia]